MTGDSIKAQLTDEAGKVKAIRFEGFDGIKASVDISDDSVTFTTAYPGERRPQQNEAGALNACQILVSYLSVLDGAAWQVERTDREGADRRARAREEVGVDCIARRDDSTEVPLSVTRVGGPEIRESFGRYSDYNGVLTESEAVGPILEAIQGKAKSDLRGSGPRRRSFWMPTMSPFSRARKWWPSCALGTEMTWRCWATGRSGWLEPIVTPYSSSLPARADSRAGVGLSGSSGKSGRRL